MKHEDRQRVAEVIERNTQRVALGELAAAGKSHVRVISGERALELIEAVVDQAIARRGELADLDRGRIVAEANEQFQRVARIQADAEALVHQQKDLIAGQSARIAELEQRLQKANALLKRGQRRLDNARETILNYDVEIDRLAAQVKRDAGIVEELRSGLKERTAEAQGLQDLLRTFSGRGAADGISELRATVEALVQKLGERDAAAAKQLEHRFEAGLDRTLEKISKTLHAATARPLDRPVEATDAMLARLFDRASDMESNLSRLDVEVSTAQTGIEESLARLKRLRAEALEGDAEDASPPPS
jgi:chromosome segregation ATPase